MSKDILYVAWKRRRDAEIAFDAANSELVASRRLLDELLEDRVKQTRCPACAGKKDGKKCRAHTDFHPQFK